MSIETDARQEAERRYPGRYYQISRPAFEAGAVWASEQADHVERIARNLAQTSTLTEQDALVLVKTAQKIAEVEQADREPSADTGCPHEACEIDTAGNPTRCADCGDDLSSVPDAEAVAPIEWVVGGDDAPVAYEIWGDSDKPAVLSRLTYTVTDEQREGFTVIPLYRHPTKEAN